MPDLGVLMSRLSAVVPLLAGTQFSYSRTGNTVDVRCPWGNRIRVHAPDPARFGAMTRSMRHPLFARALVNRSD